jgi:hypothetical protein
MSFLDKIFANIPDFVFAEPIYVYDHNVLFEMIPESAYDELFYEEYDDYEQTPKTIYEETKALLRTERFIDTNRHFIQQNSIIQDISREMLGNVLTDPYAQYFNQNYKVFIAEPLSILYNDPNVNSFGIAMQYFIYTDDEDSLGKTVAEASNGFTPYTKFVSFTKGIADNFPNFVNNLIFHFNGEGSGFHPFVIGYRIVFEHSNSYRMSEDTLEDLRAFRPTSNRKFHHMCVASTNVETKICIYESFLYILDPITFGGYKNKNQLKETKSHLKAEGKEIEQAVKEGKLAKSLQLLTKKYKNEIIVVFYGTNFCIRDSDKKMCIRDGYFPIRVSCGKIDQITDYDGIFELDKKLVMLYDKKGQHVAPSIFEMKDYKYVMDIVKNKSFKLKPVTLKKKTTKFENVLAFDFETYKDKNNIAIPFCACVFGMLKGDYVDKTFYGPDCDKQLVEYFYSIRTPVDRSKSKSKKPVPKIYIYGFNNAAFDNIFIYQIMYKLDPSIRYVISGSTIKYISVDNIKIMDIRLQYAGTLRSVAEAFQLNLEKDIYPYKFPNENNLYYRGEVPELKYWKNEEEYNECVKRTNNDFDLKAYTEKYCMLDCEITFEIAMKHLKECVGECNGKKFNVADCATSAGLSLKMFNQCFQTETLYQSEEKIVKKEKLAYKGGRTEVFKKQFKSEAEERLFYYDINSSYPSSMTEEMPIKFVRTLHYQSDPYVLDIKILKPHHLYLAKVVYQGNDPNFIPNILVRDEKTNEIIAVNETDFHYQWGCELIEAMKNNCRVYLREENQYTSKKIFENFANHFYNERLQVKKTNPAKAMFYKTVMNSLYGKFGQRVFNKVGMAENCTEMFKQISGDNNILLNVMTAKDLIIYEYKQRNAENDSIGKLMRFASYITALSRCKLSALMRDVGHENVYYCDTDSVFTSVKPNDEFVDQTILGKWKMECEPIRTAIFLAPKLYTYETENGKRCQKAKGIRAEKINYEDYQKLVDGDIKSISQVNDMFYRSLNDICIEEQERSIQVVYNKRVWSGNNSTAFQTIEDWKNNKTDLKTN